jgi:hypothetical protein
MSEQEVPQALPGTRVTFLDQTGAKSVDAVIADSVIVKRILPNIVTKMNLPVMGPDGQPMSYSLDHKEGGQRLREDQTLVEARVRNGDHLIVYPEIVAGALELPAGNRGSGRREGPRRVVTGSPRQRRLKNDFLSLTRLAEESSIFSFVAGRTYHDAPPESYVVRFHGRGLYRESSGDRVVVRETHEVGIQLGAGYPRMMPELGWRTPIFHPNISSSGIVCLGGYSTHWVPSLQLDQLCVMLWNMIRYANYDVESPYNREAAGWVRAQKIWQFPLDDRNLRDRPFRATASDELPHSDWRRGPCEISFLAGDAASQATGFPSSLANSRRMPDQTTPGGLRELEPIVEAEVVDSLSTLRAHAEIRFIDR